MKIGVCYYPEHWPETEWQADANKMVELGIRVVRIGEFAWSRLEPSDGNLQFDWLGRALDTLGNAGLEVVLGTPTATPPKWLIDKYADVLAKDKNGTVRQFGSRRHYCFSSTVYRHECARIVKELAEQFGKHEAVTAWQTDNEYGCHDTIFSYSDAARTGFQGWCADRYKTIESLNNAWGNVFWSMEYSDFSQLELPHNAVTELNPAHELAFWRFSTDQVKAFNKIQTDILRQYSPERDLIHNYMGNFIDFDHYVVAEDLDVASWDNYPLGFLDRDGSDSEDLQRWYRTGHPDSSALHHDLYRGVGKGRWWVMEQQPGPVNWAPHNPSPLAGMVRLWGFEAMAHGAEVMSYFRWRQAPFAQEQNHTGLCLPNGAPDTAAEEVAILYRQIQQLGEQQTRSASVAMIFDYEGNAMQDLSRFQGDEKTAFELFSSIYSACRRSGVNIDILPHTADLSEYAMVLLPNQVIGHTALIESLKRCKGQILLFPGTGCRESDFATPASLAPGAFRELINLTVSRSESLPSFARPTATTDEGSYRTNFWRERIESDIVPSGFFEDGWGFYYRQNNIHYINAVLAQDDLNRFLSLRMKDAGITVRETTEGLRFRQLDDLVFAFNFGPETVELQSEPVASEYLVGQKTLNAGELAVWSVKPKSSR